MATLHETIELLKGLITGEIAQTGPFYVTVDVTRRCNLRCPGCRYHSSTINIPSPGDQEIMDISLDLFKEMCDELKTMGTRSMILIGEGEPFLHPRLFDLISFAKRVGLHVTLLTNGTLLDETRINLLLDSRLDILKVSCWASSIEAYQRNYPGANPGNFEKIAAGLKLLANIKAEHKRRLPFVVLHQPISRNNFQDIDAMVELAHTTGSNMLSFSPFKTRREELAEFALSRDQERVLNVTLCRMKQQLNSLSIKENIDQTFLRYRIGEAVWQKLPCYIAWLHARVKVDGTVIPCNPCDLPMGSLKESRFDEIWNGSAYREFRKRTLTRSGLISVGRHCDCGFCCHVEDNVRVHRLFKWISPFCVGHRRPETRRAS
jgi:MoaA/NifB/PqqE/SkfB family radical SAM enzyme